MLLFLPLLFFLSWLIIDFEFYYLFFFVGEWDFIRHTLYFKNLAYLCKIKRKLFFTEPYSLHYFQFNNVLQYVNSSYFWILLFPYCTVCFTLSHKIIRNRWLNAWKINYWEIVVHKVSVSSCLFFSPIKNLQDWEIVLMQKNGHWVIWHLKTAQCMNVCYFFTNKYE